MQITISLIIPTFNRADLIVETIDSAINQNHPFREIIVVDDGSTDDTPDVLARYGKKIIVIRSKNAGVQSARNRGVAAATSKYVTFCDSDDILEPDFVEVVSSWFLLHPETQAAYVNFKKFSDAFIESDDFSKAPVNLFAGAKISGNFLYEIPDLYIRLFTIHPFYIVGCTVEKSCFDEIGGFDTKFNGIGAEDGEFTLRLVAAYKIAFCKRSLAKVRRHLGNESHNPLHVILGSAHILEYASKHHDVNNSYRKTLQTAADNLRLEAADAAFAKGSFEIASKILKYGFRRPVSLKFYIKKAIIFSPEPFRKILWNLSQKAFFKQ